METALIWPELDRYLPPMILMAQVLADEQHHFAMPEQQDPKICTILRDGMVMAIAASIWLGTQRLGPVELRLVRSFLTQYCKNKKFKMKLQSPGRFSNRMVPFYGPSRLNLRSPTGCCKVRWTGGLKRQFVAVILRLKALYNLAFVRGSAMVLGLRFLDKKWNSCVRDLKTSDQWSGLGGPEKIPTLIGSYETAKKLDCKCFLYLFMICMLTKLVYNGILIIKSWTHPGPSILLHTGAPPKTWNIDFHEPVDMVKRSGNQTVPKVIAAIDHPLE